MDDRRITRRSKFLSLILRHKPEKIGIKLNAQGWANVDELLTNFTENQNHIVQGTKMTRAELEYIVLHCPKQRYEFNADKTMIRARQGHSLPVDLGLIEVTPPDTLYHGTATRFMNSIKLQGLIPNGRHHVHLTEDPNLAEQIGKRHGKPIVIAVDAIGMFNVGAKFYKTANNVWLTDSVPVSSMQVLEVHEDGD